MYTNRNTLQQLELFLNKEHNINAAMQIDKQQENTTCTTQDIKQHQHESSNATQKNTHTQHIR